MALICEGDKEALAILFSAAMHASSAESPTEWSARRIRSG